jgi:energy-coupling factor transporter transmembrane protein EcfT
MLNHCRHWEKKSNLILVCSITKFLKNHFFWTISIFLCIVFFCFILFVFFHAQSQMIYYLNIGSYDTHFFFCFLIIFFVQALKGTTKWPVFPQTHFTPHYPIEAEKLLSTFYNMCQTLLRMNKSALLKCSAWECPGPCIISLV